MPENKSTATKLIKDFIESPCQNGEPSRKLTMAELKDFRESVNKDQYEAYARQAASAMGYGNVEIV